MKVYQIVVMREPVTPEEKAKMGAWRQCMMGASYYKPEYSAHYQHVADVDTDEPEEAFRLMNLWNEEWRVTRHLPLHSMSVGDIVEVANGDRYMVDTIGFVKLEN